MINIWAYFVMIKPQEKAVLANKPLKAEPICLYNMFSLLRKRIRLHNFAAYSYQFELPIYFLRHRISLRKSCDII